MNNDFIDDENIEAEARQRLVVDLIFRIIQKEKEFKTRLIWLLSAMIALQFVISATVIWYLLG